MNEQENNEIIKVRNVSVQKRYKKYFYYEKQMKTILATKLNKIKNEKNIIKRRR